MFFSLRNCNMGCSSFAVLQRSLNRYLRLRGAVLAETGDYTIRLQIRDTVSYSYSLEPEENGVSITASCDCDAHAAVGHLLSLLDVREGAGFTPLKEAVFHSHKKSVRGMYFATHFFNFYHSAPVEEVYDVIEDLALQGCNSLLVWFDMHHFTSMRDPEAVELAERLKQFLLYSKSIGMSRAMLMLSNESFADSPGHLRAKWEARGNYLHNLNGHFHVEICPSTEEGMAEILRQRREMLEYFRSVELDYVVYWPYDQGGCSCEKCEPWGTNGFLKILPHFQNLAKAYFPNAEVIVSTWDFDGFIKGEWDVLYKKLTTGELPDIRYLMAFFYHGNLPQCFAENGVPAGIHLIDFPEISMHCTMPWGGYGGVLDMDFLEGSWRGDFFDGGYPYSEGLFECVNKYIVLSCFYSGRYKTVREALRAFIRQYFCCDGEDMLLAMEKMQHNTKKEPVQTATQEQQFRVEAAPEQIDFIWEVFEKYNRILPEKITSHYMFRIFYLRSLIDYELLHNEGLLSRSEKARNALLELEEIYHTSEKSCEYLRPPVDFKT